MAAKSTAEQRSSSWLLLFAGVGVAVPGGLFVYWALHDFTTLSAALQDWYAVAFVADVLITTAILAVYFAQHPPGRYRWPWFLALSLLGTLAFGLAMYLWLNRRKEA